MIRKIALYSLLLIVCCSCDEKIASGTDKCIAQVHVSYPEDMPIGPISAEIYTFKNVSTGAVAEQPAPAIELLPGIYDISYEASLKSGDGRAFRLRAMKQSCVVSNKTEIVELEANYIADNDDLIICEIFFTGTQQPSGNSYNGDDYVMLYNNTDHVVYADGITLFESKFNTTDKNDYTPDIMAQAMTVHALYTIPGSGTDHPVNPGCYILLADNGMDHRMANPNSFDLSCSDFEWYDVSSSPSNLDIDNPDVPNLDKWYCYTQSYWMLHNRGFKAFGIARIPISRDEYLQDYFYQYEYELVTEVGTFPMDGRAYRLPNAWILDVVNCSVASDYAWNVCAPALDCGWTSCGTTNNDKSRFGKSVRRKLLYIADNGQPIYKDTNNSTADFNSYVTPSMLENEQRTYDGIIPMN